MKRRFDIGIDHKMLEGAKGAFDTCLQIAVKKAIATGSNEGSATLRVSFEILNGADLNTGETYLMPAIKYKAGFTVPIKDGVDGKVMEQSRLILKENGQYSLVNEQVSMEEIMEEDEPEAYRGEKHLREVR